MVQSLNTRATVLVTLEGNHVRIPNAIIFKEILVNSSVLPKTRTSFDVVIPYEASTATAMDVSSAALRSLEGILPDPPARMLVEALEPGGVRLRAYFWAPLARRGGYKLTSDAKLKVKVALQQAGITPSPTNVVALSVAGNVPVALSRADGVPRTATVGLRRDALTHAQVQANLSQDARAAAIACDRDDDHPPPIEHVLREAQATSLNEGTNLLAASGNGAVKHDG